MILKNMTTDELLARLNELRVSDERGELIRELERRGFTVTYKQGVGYGVR